MNNKDIIDAVTEMRFKTKITYDVINYMRDMALAAMSQGQRLPSEPTTSPTMKPFNLQQALAGKEVITGSGRAITQLVLFDIAGVKKLMGVGLDALYQWEANGKYNQDGTEHYLDLFMAPETKEVWVNVYRDSRDGEITTGETTYVSQAEAEKYSFSDGDFKILHTYPITVNL